MASHSTRRLRPAAVTIAAALSIAGLRAEIVDRIAAIVDLEAVTSSEVETELRLAAMLNETDLDLDVESSGDALRRLIDRKLVLQDLAVTPFLLVQPAETERQLGLLRDESYRGGRDFNAALAHYGLTEADCRPFVEESIAFERYVTFRFKTGLGAEPAEVESYYRDEYLPLRRERGEPEEPLESVSRFITQILLERRASRLLEERLQELRLMSRIEILEFSSGEQRR